MKPRHISFLVVGIVSLLLSFIYCPPFDIYFDDKEIFKYSGFLIGKGEVPYKDFFDHKPPLIFFINYLGLLLGDWGMWIIDATLVLLVSLRFLKLNIDYKVRYPVILPILFNFILRHHAISFGIGMTREYTTILLLLACCLLFSKSRSKYFFLGMLAASIFFIQQEQVIILVPFVVYSLLTDIKGKKRKPLNVLVAFAMGCIVVMAPILLYFLLNNALPDLWNSAFVFNTRWYTTEEKPGLVRQLITLKNFIYSLNFDVMFLMALAMGSVSLYVGHERKGLLITALMVIPLSFISEFLSGKLSIGNASCTYYLLPLGATIPFLLFIIFVFTRQQLFQNQLHQFIHGVLLIAGFVMSTAMYLVNYSKYPQDGIAKSNEIRYLKNKNTQDYQLYVFNHSNFTYAYNYFKVLPPSKWLYHYFWEWYPNWDKDGKLIQSITADLKKHRTRFIIYDPQNTEFISEQNNRVWHGFLYSNYRQVPGLIIWEAK